MPPERRYDEVSGGELYRKLAMGEPVVLLDVRTAIEFEKRHIPGSMLIPLQSLDGRIAEVPNSGVPIAVLCEEGVRGHSACRVLAEHGLGPLLTLEGGLSRWPGPLDEGPSVVRTHPHGLAPSSFLIEHFDLLPKGLALDVAMGPGRNAIYLATRGFDVDGVDARADYVRSARVAARKLSAPIRAIHGNLEDGSWVVPFETYDVVLVFNYLHRPLFKDLRDAVVPGGVIVYQTFTTEQARFGRPTNPDFLLLPGELRERFSDWQILRYREFVGPSRRDDRDRAVASIVARKPED